MNWFERIGRFEQTYVTAYAEIANVVVQYQPLRILHHNNNIKNQARAAITAAGGDPDDPNITYIPIAINSAWMRDKEPVYVVEDGEMRIQDWGFDARGGAFGNFLYGADDAVPIEVGAYLGMPADVALAGVSSLVSHTGQVVDDLLIFARLETGSQGLDRQSRTG